MKLRSLLSALLCGALLLACLPLSGCGEPPADDFSGKTILFYGDSLTAFGTWPLSVSEEMNTYLLNTATGGINTKEALERFDRFVTNREADYVTLCFGMNDLLMQVKNVPQVKPDKFKENLKTMCEKIEEMGAVPLLLTSSYLDEDKFYSSQGQKESNYAGVGGPLAWLDTYNEKTRELAEEEGYHLIDIRKACDEYSPKEFLSADGIHLGELGNQVYTDTIVAYLKDHFHYNPDAEKITERFPTVSSPAEPAVTDFVTYEPADWDTPNIDEMTFEKDEDGYLHISNNNGRWPDAQFINKECLLVPMEGSELVYDFSTTKVNTSIILFFGGATPLATTEGKYIVINDKLGVKLEAGSGDIAANQNCKGSIKLTDLGIPETAIDDNNNLLISGIKVFVAGAPMQDVIIRQLAVSTKGAPNQ